MTASGDGWPAVSVLLPVRDEARHLDACLASLAAQQYGGALEIVAAEGGSTDATPALLAAWQQRLPGLRVVDNPRRLQAHGLNAALEAAAGVVVIRADAHSVYALDYVAASVAALCSTGAAAVGGRMRPVGTSPFGRAVAVAMTSPLATGPAAFHHAEVRREVDTVYLGAVRRADALAVGWRALPSGAAEDADFYYRLRRAGGRVLLDPAIRSRYRPRDTWRGLARQHLRYGAGKAEMLWLNGRLPSSRPLAPLGLVAGLGLGVVLTLTGRGRPAPLAALLLAWSVALGAVAGRGGQPLPDAGRVVAATATMHLTYGVGLLIGLLRGPPRVLDRTSPLHGGSA